MQSCFRSTPMSDLRALYRFNTQRFKFSSYFMMKFILKEKFQVWIKFRVKYIENSILLLEWNRIEN